MQEHTIAACACVASVALITHFASAQSFNVDVNADTGAGAGVPASTYGGAAASAGTWNDIGNPDLSITLNDLSGTLTTVTLTRNTVLGDPFQFNNAGTTGDVELLMDDLHDCSVTTVPVTYTFAGLTAGTYDVYTYAWAPDFPTVDFTIVAVNATGPQTIGGAPGSNSLTTPGHYALHTVTIAAGENIVISADGDTATQSFGSVNGIQIVLKGGGAPCPANIVTSGSSATTVDIDDLLAVISAWGPCPPPPAACPADIVTAGSSAGVVDIDDLLAVISAWGPCP